jgi:hypothetical protein
MAPQTLHLTSKRRTRRLSLQNLPRRTQIGNMIINRFKNPESHSRRLQHSLTYATQTLSINIRPSMHLPQVGLMHITVKDLIIVLIRLDNMANPQAVDTSPKRAAKPRAMCSLHSFAMAYVSIGLTSKSSWIGNEGKLVSPCASETP